MKPNDMCRAAAIVAASLTVVLVVGSEGAPADSVPPPGPAAVGGKEYSNTFDETA